MMVHVEGESLNEIFSTLAEWNVALGKSELYVSSPGTPKLPTP
jgi:hypothetical protein